MFSLSPIAPTAPTRFEAPGNKGDDWCGTKPPTVSMPPRDPKPFRTTLEHVTSGYLSLLEASSALNPIVPMVYRPGTDPVQPDLDGAISRAKLGIASIEAAMAAAPATRSALQSTLANALQDARRGFAQLSDHATQDKPFDFGSIVSTLEAASTKLHAAGTILTIELGEPNGFRPFGNFSHGTLPPATT